MKTEVYILAFIAGLLLCYTWNLHVDCSRLYRNQTAIIEAIQASHMGLTFE